MTRSLAVLPLLFVVAACGGDASRDTPAADTSAATPAITADTGAAQGAALPAGAAMLNPDSATAEQLRAIPGLDSATAAALVAGRPYANMTAVDRVLGGRLSEAQRDTVYTRLWKPLDLNSATAAEIELIPGVGPRMRHEFEEYRPYRGIEQFRREIGKYVDEQEVARLERYVTIR